MDVPLKLFKTSIEKKKIYRFSLDYKNNPDPHFYICIEINDQMCFLSCCTSQFESSLRFITKHKFDPRTLVLVGSKGQSPFSKDTYVNCNNIEILELKDLYKLQSEDKLEVFEDMLDEEIYNLLIEGLLLSTLIPRSLKKLLQNI